MQMKPIIGLNTLLNALGFEGARLKTHPRSRLALAIAGTAGLWAVSKYVGWFGAMAVVFVATFSVASLVTAHKGSRINRTDDMRKTIGVL
jgi:hypothetical protein